jgi:hypothetical protein
MRIIPAFLHTATLVLFLAFINSTVQAQCDQSLLENSRLEIEKFTYLQHFRIKSARHTPNATSAQFSVNLTKGNTYVFTAVNDRSQDGKAIVKLYDDFKYYTGNETEDKRLLKGFSFSCNKTGTYYLTIKFDNSGPGCAIVIMSMVNQKETSEKK